MPLSALRVVEIGSLPAAAYSARLFADFGAEVIKIEPPSGDPGRRAAPLIGRGAHSATFAFLNFGKHSATGDATALLKTADVCIASERGIDLAAARAANPGLIVAELSWFGATGPYAGFWGKVAAIGKAQPTLEHASGLPSTTGRPDDPPVMGHIAFGDATGGLNAAAALLVALLHRKRAGEGQHIDLSQVECMLPFAAPAIIACSAGETPPRIGNRHPDHAPHGIFPCRGKDSWLAVTVTDDAMWQACAHVIGRSDLTSLDTQARLADQDRLEQAMTAWMATQDADKAMAVLQEAGVAAGVTRAPFALFNDPHLLARGYWRPYTRPFIGDFPQSVLPFREGAAPYPIECPAPTLGQHTDTVLTALLDYPPDRLAQRAKDGVTGTQAVPSRRTLK